MAEPLSETGSLPRPLWRRVWSRPEADVSDVAFSGELLVAGLRLLLVVLLLYFPGRVYLPRLSAGLFGGALDPALHRDVAALLGIAALALLGALGIYSTLQRSRGQAWIGFASSVLDITLVSTVLAVVLFAADPLAAVTDAAVFPAYLLVIAGTTLRYDARITLVTGALALAQYGAIVLAARWWGDAAGAVPPGFDGGVQAGRLALLATATLVAATVVVRSRELRLLSTRDRFTGLLNRTVFDERLAAEHRAAQRTGERFAVAMIDIDHFKRFNDEHGHAAGDEALRRVAEMLRDSCRASDVVARYGGEEFALVLPGVRRAAACALCERIRFRVATEPLLTAGRSRPVSLTVSIGVASCPEDGPDGSTVLACADRRLYQAKRRGRDRVVGPPTALPLAEQEIPDLDAAWVAPLVPPDPAGAAPAHRLDRLSAAAAAPRAIR
jgi:diguanylate cyclase (GGDEF)-like protein